MNSKRNETFGLIDPKTKFNKNDGSDAMQRFYDVPNNPIVHT